jgi:hypothetical protein
VYVTAYFRLQLLYTCPGRTIAGAVSRWLPTAAAQVRARVWQVGCVVDKMASGQVFSEYSPQFSNKRKGTT